MDLREISHPNVRIFTELPEHNVNDRPETKGLE
jgi:hypothetical protein